MNEKIKEKHQNCNIFYWWICVLGILVPMLYLSGIFIIPIITHSESLIMPIRELVIFGVFAVFLLLVTLMLPFFALQKYSKGKESEEKIGDRMLYFCGVITIILIAFIVNYTGGIKHSLMSFYFFFIPAAIAIAFNGKTGLWITGVCCMASIVILFWLSDSTKIQYETVHCGVFSAYQLFLIMGIELRKNHKLSKK